MGMQLGIIYLLLVWLVIGDWLGPVNAFTILAIGIALLTALCGGKRLVRKFLCFVAGELLGIALCVSFYAAVIARGAGARGAFDAALALAAAACIIALPVAYRIKTQPR
ncbi:hypothetical protein HY091_01690 [Candidatus Kaiserbacteria bacterium]|nr:hypothetical protein [Candidatus Kaiserbacteria bacterium]